MSSSHSPMQQLLEIMAALRHPQNGCPWDVEQNFQSIAHHTIEEAYEVVDAIDRADMQDLREELGDLLLQVVFHSRMAEEQGVFAFADVVHTLNDKLIRRHPHVFGDGRLESAAQQEEVWEAVKAEEKKRQVSHVEDTSALAGIGSGMPPFVRALKLQKKAAKTGFDWPTAEAVLPKMQEELEEIAEALQSGDAHAVEEELGDMLFVLVNMARKTGIDPDKALRQANTKFERRFRHMERLSPCFAELSLEEQEQLWLRAKQQEK